MFSLIVAFVAFLLSRYATGMASRPAWRPLRAAGSYLLATMLLMTAMTVAMVLAAWQKLKMPDTVVAYAAAVVQLVLAAELLINFVLDLYRPRLADREDRVSFDSRLLGLLAEPQRVGHSIAETLSYQFGFDVSKTWFYRLVSRAFVPLLLFGVAALIALSALVYVPPGQECVVLRWGRVEAARPTLKPGLRVKWPWPVETVERFNVGHVYDLLLGLMPKGARPIGPDGLPRPDGQEPPLEPGQRKTRLWRKAHGFEGRMEKDFLVPDRPYAAGTQREAGTPPVAIVKLVVQVRYRIHDVYRFGLGVADGHKMLESLANRELIRYCSGVTVLDERTLLDSSIASGATAGVRDVAAAELRNRIQRAVDDPRIRLGVEIVDVGLVAVHPPEDAAQAYEAVLGAESEAETLRSEGRSQANRELSAAAGGPLATRLLALSIRKADRLAQLQPIKDPKAFEALLRQSVADVDIDLNQYQPQLAQAKLMGRVDEADLWQTLYDANMAYRQLLEALRADRAGQADTLARAAAQAEQETERRLSEATAKVATKIAEARAFRWQKEIREGALAMEFARESLPYRNPAIRKVYLADRLYGTWEKVLPRARKYVIGVDPDRIESWLNYERPERSPAGPDFGPGQTSGGGK
jgi:regulator of protease activity HflC (stomatin/prohibitin superfamily)